MTPIYLALGLLLLGSLLALGLKGNLTRAWVSIGCQGLASLIVLAAVLPVLFGGPELHDQIAWSYPVDRILFRVDALTAFFLAFSLPMTLLGSIYAVGYLAPSFDKKSNAGVHFALLSLVSLSFILIYAVQNAMVFLLGWEIAALSAWLLVIWDHRNPKIRFAGFNYLVSTHLSFLFLIAAFMVIHSVASGYDFPGFEPFLRVSSPLRNLAFLLFMTSFGLKSAFFPFHTWLPRAHSAAPAHVSALMSGVIHKAGIYGMIRMGLLIGTPDSWMGWYIVGFSALSAFVGVLYTVTQRDLKRLLGYSSTENVGIAGIGIGLGFLGLHGHLPALVAFGFGGALLHVFNHALFKCLLFYAAGSIYRMTHTIDLEKLGGLNRQMPHTALFFLLGGLAISALPPFNGFVSEFLIYAGLFDPSVPDPRARVILVLAAGLLAFVGGISAIAITRAFGVSFLGSSRDSRHVAEGESPRTMRFAMSCHALGVIIIGLFPALGVRLVQHPTRQLLRLLPGSPGESPVLENSLNIVSPLSYASGALIVAVGLMVLARRTFAMGAQRGPTWGCGYVAVNPRMQYTGSSFSAQFISVFQRVLAVLRREKLPEGPFPGHGFLNTHYVDATERKMFKVIGAGEKWITAWTTRMREETTLSFGLGLIALVILLVLIVSS